MNRKITYVNPANGRKIYLQVDWKPQTNIIPPPTIDIYDGNTRQTASYEYTE